MPRSPQPAQSLVADASRSHCTPLSTARSNRTDSLLIPSKDSPASTDGTWRCVPDFQNLVRSLCDRQKPKIFTLVGLTANQRWDNGVDFENAQELVDSIGETYLALNEVHLGDDEIMVDVTGGQKPSSIAGAAVSLERGGRRFQYVSPKGYKLRAYDITYRTQ